MGGGTTLGPTSYALTLPAANSLESYIQTVNSYPILTHEQETSLAQRFRESGDLAAARQLVLSHMRVVVSIARGYSGYGLPLADLVQEGTIGLMKAVKRFDPWRGVRLVSFALHWIRAAIHEFILSNWRIVKVATTKAQRKLFFNLRSLKQDLRTTAAKDVKAIADHLGVRSTDVLEMDARLTGRDVSLDPTSNEQEDEFAPIAYLPSEESEPSVALEQEETTKRLNHALAGALGTLDSRSRRILEARWLAEKKTATLDELGREFGITAERVRQLEAKALAKLKTAIAAVV